MKPQPLRASGARWRPALPWAALAVLVTALHLPAVNNYFDNDDAWNYVLEAELALDHFESAFQAGANYLGWQNLNRLLPDLSWIPRYALFDLWMPGWKLPSIALHTLNTLLLGAVLLRLFRRAGLARPDAAWVGAALFGLSPLHAQPVSWIGGTYDLMLSTALLLALLAFERGRDRLAGLACLAACMCKEQGVLAAPMVALYWLCFDRTGGWRGALRRLWPSVAGVALIVGLRRLQTTMATVALDPQLTRSVGIDAMGVFHDTPLAAFAGLATPLRSLLELPIAASAIAVAALCAVGLAVGPRAPKPAQAAASVGVWARLRLAALLVGLALAFVLPVALLREFGRPLGLERIVFNERYLYVSTLFVAGLAGAALLYRTTPLRRVLAVLCVGATLWTGAAAVATAVRGRSPAETLLEALQPLRSPAKGGQVSDVYLLTNLYREETFRLAMSRWVLHHTGVQIHWVQRGCWRVLERDPDRNDGLDFMDSYVRVRRERFSPELVASVPRSEGPGQAQALLLRDGSPGVEHAVTTPNLPPKGPRDRARPESLPLLIDSVPGAFSFTTETLPNGTLRFGIGEAPNTPRGWSHRAAAWLRAPIDAGRTLGFRITYTATARPQPVGLARAFEFGYLELHWRSREQHPDLTYVVMPIAFDGQKHVETLWLDIDPVWAASGLVGAVGIHPLDRAGEITIHALDAVALPKQRAPSSADP